MAAPTAKELELLKDFRARVKNIAYKYTEYERSDQALVRWLRARDHNVAKAEEMIRKTLAYLESKPGIQGEDPSQYYAKLIPWYISGFTPENNPIVLAGLGGWDIKKIVKSGEQDALELYGGSCFVKLLKLMEEKSVLPDKVVTQFVVIIDVEGYSLTQLTSFGVIELSLHMVTLFEQNCPETLKTCYVVNANAFFAVLFSIVKPFLTTRTLSKLHVFGKDKEAWKKALAEQLPSDQLSEKYGGTVPDQNLLQLALRSNSQDEDEPEFAEIKIGPGKKVHVQATVDSADSRLIWSFRITHCDIGFRITRDNTEVLGYQKYGGSPDTYEGSLHCDKPGKYMLEFDNSYSRLRSKVLDYCIDVIAPVNEKN